MKGFFLQLLQSDRGGISVDTEYGERKIISRLRVAKVTNEDVGTFTCSQASTRPGSVMLYVHAEGIHIFIFVFLIGTLILF